MKKDLFIGELTKGLEEMSLFPPSLEVLDRLFLFQEILSKWNQKMNLTAHRDPITSLEKNFLDCMPLLSFISFSQEALDIGSGAGFPGALIKICLPNIKMTLLEADQKKAAFLSTIIRELSLKDVQVANIFLDQNKVLEMGWQDRFDGIVSRATIPLRKILALVTEPLKVGGRFLGMASRQESFELGEVVSGQAFQIEKEVPYQLPFSKLSRKIIVFKKI